MKDTRILGGKCADAVRIAVDCMGGEHGPMEFLLAVQEVALHHPNAKFLLCGNKPLLESLLATVEITCPVEVIDAAAVVKAETKWGDVVLNDTHYSMGSAVNCVVSGLAEAVVSGGHTASYVALCAEKLQRKAYVSRAVLAGFVPTIKHGTSILVDAGAGLHATAEQLAQFGVLGWDLAKNMLKVKDPQIGILNVGDEWHKGPDRLRDAHSLIKKLTGNCRFIEASELTTGTVDVIVTDGFAGNIAIKSAEGVFRTLVRSIKQALGSSLLMKVSGIFAKPLLKSALERFEVAKHNGGLWLGLRHGVAVKSHGRGKAKSIASAIKVAIQAVKSKCISSHAITKALAECKA